MDITKKFLFRSSGDALAQLPSEMVGSLSLEVLKFVCVVLRNKVYWMWCGWADDWILKAFFNLCDSTIRLLVFLKIFSNGCDSMTLKYLNVNW